MTRLPKHFEKYLLANVKDSPSSFRNYMRCLRKGYTLRSEGSLFTYYDHNYGIIAVFNLSILKKLVALKQHLNTCRQPSSDGLP